MPVLVQVARHGAFCTLQLLGLHCPMYCLPQSIAGSTFSLQYQRAATQWPKFAAGCGGSHGKQALTKGTQLGRLHAPAHNPPLAASQATWTVVLWHSSKALMEVGIIAVGSGQPAPPSRPGPTL